ncbi:hypothetical protein E2C01_057896 [Portunus trituberculatus]|uniref:Uncharacterized protein n=1 Tax=Portunus trituberculatus TaxID=210409 RepID=A0A5B7H4L8_PORTR|nr:hypothetical protein [Portunus trituberculatus]
MVNISPLLDRLSHVSSFNFSTLSSPAHAVATTRLRTTSRSREVIVGSTAKTRHPEIPVVWCGLAQRRRRNADPRE